MLVHMFDNLEDAEEPWAPCAHGWCAGVADHMSCSLVNARIPVLFNYGLGVVLASDTEWVCAYTADGGTQGKSMGGCYEKPWCYEGHWWNCKWDEMRDLVANAIDHGGGYNEVIVSADYWRAHLPHIVQAVVCRDECGRARAVHRQFLRHYGLTAAQTPLLYMRNDGFEDIS